MNFPAIKLMLKYVVYVNAFEFRHTRCVSRFVSHSGILACPAAPPGLRDSFMSPLYRSVPFRSLPPSAVSADGLHRTREVRRLPPRASFVNVEASTSICVCVCVCFVPILNRVTLADTFQLSLAGIEETTEQRNGLSRPL